MITTITTNNIHMGVIHLCGVLFVLVEVGASPVGPYDTGGGVYISIVAVYNSIDIDTSKTIYIKVGVYTSAAFFSYE